MRKKEMLKESENSSQRDFQSMMSFLKLCKLYWKDLLLRILKLFFYSTMWTLSTKALKTRDFYFLMSIIANRIIIKGEKKSRNYHRYDYQQTINITQNEKEWKMWEVTRNWLLKRREILFLWLKRSEKIRTQTR